MDILNDMEWVNYQEILIQKWTNPLIAQSCTIVYLFFFTSNQSLKCCDSPRSWLIWFILHFNFFKEIYDALTF